MWHLTELSFENYRTFERAEMLELRPLTVLIGRNNSGKSAIARLPLLLSRGLERDAEAPLELEFGGHDLGASFADLATNRETERGITIGLSASDGATTVKLRVKVGYWKEFNLQAIREYRLEHEGNIELDVRWTGQGDPRSPGLAYESERTTFQPGGLFFEGLSPLFNLRADSGERHPFARQNACGQILSHLAAALTPLHYLREMRGCNHLQDPARGMSIVEHPEMGLHPSAHGTLADRYIQAAQLDSSRFLIETHSENFILRLRRRIAEGTLPPDDVALYWIEDDVQSNPRVKRITLDEKGGIDFWPRGVFTEDLREVQAIRRAQMSFHRPIDANG